MDDFKSVTVSYLRDLARKHLGPGYSKLNKTELIAALVHVVPGLKKVAELAGIAIPKPPAKGAMASGKAARDAQGTEKKPARKQESQKKAPEKKREPERKKEPEGKKVSEKKNPEGKKGSQKKEPEAKKAPEKKAAPPPAPKAAPPEAKKATPPPVPKAAPPEQKKAAPPEPKAAPPEQKKAAPPEPKAAPPEPKAAPPEPKAAQPEIKAAPPEPKAAPPEQKKAAAPEPKAAAQPEPKAAPSPEKKAASPKDRKPASGGSAAAKAEELAQSLKPAQVVNFPPRSRSFRSAEEAWNEDTADTAAERAAASHPAEPLLEGFFVARVVGERELRRHHLTEAQQAPRAVTSNATGYEENLGELPVDYESDVAMALARDPNTLFVSWDFTPATRARAMDGLDSPRPVLRVYEGDKLVRVEEFVLEARSFYIHGLPAGRSYRVEAHFVGRDGRSRRIGPSTHPVRLPHAGLSQDTAVRFMRMPPPPPPTVRAVAQQPLPPPSAPTQQSVVDEGEFITWNRVPLPGSADVADVLASRRERIQRQAAAEAPGAPVPSWPAHLEVSARPLGSSELAAARGLRLSGASELSGAAGRGRGGSSEQSGAAGRGRDGSSEQIFWIPPPSGRGR